MSRYDDEFALTVDDHLDQFGETVTYHPADGVPFELSVIPRLQGLTARALDQGRTVGYPIELEISKADLETVNENADKVEVPGAWVRQFRAGIDPVVKLAVVAILEDRSDDSWWVIGLGLGA